MTEQEPRATQETPEQVEPEVPATAPAPPAAATPQATRTGGGRVLGVVALLLALVALGASGYLWYRIDVQQKLEQGMAVANLSSDIKGVNQNLALLEKQQTAVVTRQDKLDATIQATIKDSIQPLQAQQGELANQQQALLGSVEKVYQDLDRSLDSYALEEIEQLLRIANNSAALAGDRDTALAALKLADDRLQDLGNPKLLEVRKQLADEIGELKTVQPVDLPGIALQLARLADNVPQLPLLNEPERPVTGTNQPGEAPAEEGTWERAGRELLADLKGLVRIQNVTEQAKPLLTPEQRYFLFNNLQLMLSGAQIAALRKDNETFQSNLSQARQWIEEYFDTEADATRQLLADLTELADVQLAPPLPDIASSLATLKEIKQRMAAQ